MGKVVAPLIGDLVDIGGVADIVAGISGGFGLTTGGTVFDCDGVERDGPEDMDREREPDCADLAPAVILDETELALLADTEPVLESDVRDPV